MVCLVAGALVLLSCSLCTYLLSRWVLVGCVCRFGWLVGLLWRCAMLVCFGFDVGCFFVFAGMVISVLVWLGIGLIMLLC